MSDWTLLGDERFPDLAVAVDGLWPPAHEWTVRMRGRFVVMRKFGLSHARRNAGWWRGRKMSEGMRRHGL